MRTTPGPTLRKAGPGWRRTRVLPDGVNARDTTVWMT
jgi:hypothetical protein